MKWYNPKTWMQKKPEPAKEIEKKEQKKSSGFFSEDLNGVEVRDRASWIESNLFQKTFEDIRAMSAGGGYASDSAQAMDSSIKGAYTLSDGRIPQDLLAWYMSHGFIGYQSCSIIAQHWLVDKACSMPGRDAIKNGYELTVNDGTEVGDEIIKTIRDLDKKYKVKKNLVEFRKFNCVFGVRVMIFKVESKDDKYYEKPFNIEGVAPGSYKGMSQVDPYWITPELDESAVSDPSSSDFYEPTYWRISGKRYHKSHLIVSRYTELTDVLKPTYQYGGIPLTQMIYNRVYASERIADDAPMLSLTKRVNVIKTDMDKAMANQKAFEEKMTVFNQFRDNYGIRAIGKEEELTQLDTSLADLDATIMTEYQLVSSIANIPATKLLGTSPKGFGASGEYEIESYNDNLECIQDGEYTPILDRHYELIIKSEIEPKNNIDAFNFEIVWNPIDTPSAKEAAEINEINARTDAALIATGAINSTEIRDRIISDKRSGYSGLEPLEIKFIEEGPGIEPPDVLESIEKEV